MKHWMSIAFTLLSIPLVYAEPLSRDVVEESLYQEFKLNLLSHNKMKRWVISSFEQKLLVDAVWDLADDGATQSLDALQDQNTLYFDLSERLRIAILRLRYNRALTLPEDLTNELLSHLKLPQPEVKIIYLIAAYENVLAKAGHTNVISLAKAHPEYEDVADDEERKKDITNDVVTDLFFNTPDATTYMNGEYVKSVKLFNFCRSNRLYPCLMVMKDIHGEVVRNADGSIWTHKALASSKHGLPSYTKNGNTPTGVFTIDSVMPVADQQVSYGKYRRMILNFVPKSKGEVLLRSLLPTSSQNEDWWKASVTARDIGRNLFRIHGTLKQNTDSAVPYYPFVRTSGCIAQRENTYDGVTYKDQRDLLDRIMEAMDLAPTYDNEVLIKGILYVVELDDTDAPVEAKDLAQRGIE